MEVLPPNHKPTGDHQGGPPDWWSWERAWQRCEAAWFVRLPDRLAPTCPNYMGLIRASFAVRPRAGTAGRVDRRVTHFDPPACQRLERTTRQRCTRDPYRVTFTGKDPESDRCRRLSDDALTIDRPTQCRTGNQRTGDRN